MDNITNELDSKKINIIKKVIAEGNIHQTNNPGKEG